MTLSPESRAEWILARLEAGEHPGDLSPAGATELDRAELAGEAAECGEIWRALETLDDRIASERPSGGVRSAFQALLADALAREGTRPANRFRHAGVFGWRPRLAPAGLAAAAALMAIAALSLWRPVAWSPGEVPRREAVVNSPASIRLGAVLAGSGKEAPASALELGRVLETDPDPNIRLAALDVFAERFPKSELEDQVARALARESDPLVRFELIRTIGERRLLRSRPALRELALDSRLDDLARDEIARVMTRLGS